MRFSELMAEKISASGGLLKIPDAEFISLINDWTKTMAGYRYRRETRVEHWQEAIDIIYTALEKELQSIDPNTIMAHKKWDAMMLAAQTNFPEHIRIYHPTLVEQQRVSKLVQASTLRRTLKDKLELMSILKADKELGVKTISDLTVSRIQCEVLAASAQIIYANYRSSPTKDYTTSVTVGKDFSRAATATASLSTAEAKASISGSASAGASYDSGVRPLKGGFEHRIKTAINSKAEFEGSANAESKAQSLMISANAGLSAATQVSADFDYEISKSCKVKTEYFRRIMGDKFKLIQGHVHGSTAAKASASAKAKASDSVPFMADSYQIKKPGSDDSSLSTKDLVSAEVGLSGEVEIAVTMSGNAGVTLMQTADIQVSGDLKAGASAKGELKFFINGKGVGMDIGAEALLGFKVGSDQKLTLTHPSRHVSIFSLGLRESFNVGIGAEGKIKGRLTVDEVCFNASAGATLGIGSSIGFSTAISPRGALLVGYDLIAAPAILGLGELMQRHDPTHSSIHTQRMTAFCDFLNRQASNGEINQVYLDCQTRITSLIAVLDSEMDTLYDKERKMRAPGFTGYTSAPLTSIQPITAAYFEAGTTKRKKPLQVVFGSEADTGDPNYVLMDVGEGDKGKTITQENLQTDQERVRTKAVDPAKQNLHTLVADYERAKIQGSGERLAFDVIRTDLLNKTINYT